jgi:hypothetical protein
MNLPKTVISVILDETMMKYWNGILRIIALFSLFLLLASNADSQMNRDSPFLGSKIPKTSDESIFNQIKASGSSLVISEPFNNQASSDLTLSADLKNTTCNKVAFLVTLTPDSTQVKAAGFQSAKVRILADSLGTPKAVAELTLLIPAYGGSIHETIGFNGVSMPAGQNNASKITVVVDPDDEIAESDESNNILVVEVNCSN